MNLPKTLVLFRFLLAPIILSLAYFVGINSKIAIVILMYLGLISDIFDGIIARNQNKSNEKFRRLDSQTDMIFWLSIGFATWLLRPEIIKANLALIKLILFMEITVYIVSLLKFKEETCSHALLSKIWGITLLIAFTSLIGYNHAGFPFLLAITVGIISQIDRILITLIIPNLTHDVSSAYHAYLIRKGVKIKKNKYFNG